MSSVWDFLRKSQPVSKATPDKTPIAPIPIPLIVKLLLLGNSGVGKSNLLERFIHDTFNPCPHATVGLDFAVKTIPADDLDWERKRKLQIWDTSGLERNRGILPSYFRKTNGILLVYDVTDTESFSSIKNWIQFIQSNGGKDINTVLIANKCDVGPDERCISREQGEMVADSFNIKFFEVSAKLAINVEEVFMTIAMEAMSQLSISSELSSKLSGELINRGRSSNKPSSEPSSGLSSRSAPSNMSFRDTSQPIPSLAMPSQGQEEQADDASEPEPLSALVLNAFNEIMSELDANDISTASTSLIYWMERLVTVAAVMESKLDMRTEAEAEAEAEAAPVVVVKEEVSVESELEVLRVAHSAEIELLRSRSDAQLAALQAELSSCLSAAQRQSMAATAAAEEQRKGEIEIRSLILELEREKGDQVLLRQLWQTEKEALEFEINDLQRKIDSELEVLRVAHSSEIELLRSRSDAQLAALQAELSTCLSAAQCQSIAATAVAEEQRKGEIEIRSLILELEREKGDHASLRQLWQTEKEALEFEINDLQRKIDILVSTAASAAAAAAESSGPNEAFQRRRPHLLSSGIITPHPLLGSSLLHPVSSQSPLHGFANAMCNLRGSMLPVHTPMAGFVLVSVDAVEVHPDAAAAFHNRQRVLSQRRQLGGARFNAEASGWSAAKLHVLGSLRDAFLERPLDQPASFPNTIYTFHGTRVGMVSSVCQTGLMRVGCTDAGFFGLGCYSTLSVEYAARYARGDFDQNGDLRETREEDGCIPVVMLDIATSLALHYPLGWTHTLRV